MEIREDREAEIILQKMNRELLEKLDGAYCSICQTNYSLSDEIAIFCCSHIFHVTCVSRWLSEVHSLERCLPKLQRTNKQDQGGRPTRTLFLNRISFLESQRQQTVRNDQTQGQQQRNDNLVVEFKQFARLQHKTKKIELYNLIRIKG